LAPVLVTGAGGFIGQHLSAALSSQGTPVTGVDMRDLGRDAPGERWLRLDLAVADPEDLAEHVAGATAVVHLAAATDVAASWQAGFADQAASVLATQHLLRACELAEVPRVVVASSSHVYGPRVTGLVTEDAPTEPTSPYGVAKLASERLALAYARRPGAAMSVVALRYFTAYGPGSRPAMVVNRFFDAARTGKPVPLYGDGTALHTWTHVTDLVEATLAAISAAVPSGWGLVVNAAGPEAASLRRLAHCVGELVDAPVPLQEAGERAGDAAATQADVTYAARVLGWSPRIGLQEGLRLHWRHLSESPAGAQTEEARR
jgi:nucleoside-diphosphate-sugar epimerase